MRNIAKRILVLSILLVFTISCKKYEEGPMFSFSSKKARICNIWKVEAATKKVVGSSDADVTSLYTKYSVEFERNGAYTVINDKYSDTTQAVEKGIWELLYKKEQIETVGIQNEIRLSDSHVFPNVKKNNFWTILRLKEDEFWVLYIADSLQQVEYKLIPK